MEKLKQYPVTEDYLDGIRRCTSSILQSVYDIQYLTKQYSEGQFYMSEDEVAEYLRLPDTLDLPKIKRHRVSNGFQIYKKADVDEWLKTRTLGDKK